MRILVASLVAYAYVHGQVAHADDKPIALVVGGAVGAQGEVANSPLLIFAADRQATMGLVEAHIGASLLGGWLEPAIDVQLGQGGGVRSLGGLFDVRLHVMPDWRVHATVMVGGGAVANNGTGATDDHTGPRRALLAGPGVEIRIDSHWTATFELQLMLVGEDSTFAPDNPGTVGYYASHGMLVDTSAQLGATYRF
jgi:hypothetical protein